MNYQELIIDKILRNRISTTEVADCLNKTGNIPSVLPLNSKHFRVGKVFWVYAYNESNWETHKQVIDVPENSIVLVEPFECNDKAIFGELVSKYLVLYKQVNAIVVMGFLRDIPKLIKENWPIWLIGRTPIGCFNRKASSKLAKEIVIERREYYNDSIAVCDDSGVVIIPRSMHNQTFLDKLDWIEEQEDIWFDCIDRLKWNTYETVCMKKYKADE